MAVPKSDGLVRLCGDYKVTVNPVLDVNQYPLPLPDDLMTSISGGERFMKLDLIAAYQQMPQYCCIIIFNFHMNHRYTKTN